MTLTLLNPVKLSPQAIANGARCTNGVRHGTPRVDVDEPRFHRGADIPVDAFGPHATAVWAVLDRLTWVTVEDAARLLRAAGQVQRQHPLDWYPTYEVVAAARAAGEIRLADWRALGVIVRRIREMVRPLSCGVASGTYTRDAARWDDAFEVGRQTAEVLLVADRPELPADLRARLTAPWTAAFGAPAQGTGAVS
jgi:hypothetical protein